jgi:hypothetical protein
LCCYQQWGLLCCYQQWGLLCCYQQWAVIVLLSTVGIIVLLSTVGGHCAAISIDFSLWITPYFGAHRSNCYPGLFPGRKAVGAWSWLLPSNVNFQKWRRTSTFNNLCFFCTFT